MTQFCLLARQLAATSVAVAADTQAGTALWHSEVMLNTDLVVTMDDALTVPVQTLMTALLESAQHKPFPANALADDDYLAWLGSVVQVWAQANSLADDIRFKGP